MYGPAGFEDRVPYTLGVIKFSNDITVFGQIAADVPVDEIRVGMMLKAASIPLEFDRFSYVFQKASEQQDEI